MDTYLNKKIFMKDEKKNMMAVTGTTTLIIGLLVGGAIGYLAGNNKSTTTSNSASMTDTSTGATKQNGVMVGGALMTPDKDIVDNAVNASNVTTLVAAVKVAGLVDTLKGPGPFTVFAPTNDAFNKLPAGTVDTLLKPENKKMLSDILTYHVISGKYKASDLVDGMKLTTVMGQQLIVQRSGDRIQIMGGKSTATIDTQDVISSNGVTHVVNTVLIPADGVMVGGALMTPDKDIVDNAVNASNVTTLVAAVKAAGLVDTLKGAGPFTVFAPVNDAFNKLPAGTVDTLLKPENKAKLASILTYHVISGKYKLVDLKDGQVLTTVNGGTLTVKRNASTLMLIGKNSQATILTQDVISTNGVTHVIDTVLLP